LLVDPEDGGGLFFTKSLLCISLHSSVTAITVNRVSTQQPSRENSTPAPYLRGVGS
jgi:hypothetical protein